MSHTNLIYQDRPPPGKGFLKQCLNGAQIREEREEWSLLCPGYISISLKFISERRRTLRGQKPLLL